MGANKTFAGGDQDGAKTTTVECIARVQTVETDPHADLTLWQGLKRWPRIVLYCMAVSTGVSMYGYDYVVVGTTSAMPSFQYVTRP